MIDHRENLPARRQAWNWQIACGLVYGKAKLAFARNGVEMAL